MDNSPLKVIDFGLSKIYGDPEIMVSPLKMMGKAGKEKVVMKTRAGTVSNAFNFNFNLLKSRTT